MPTYVYRVKEGAKGCGRCAGEFEATQRMSDAPLTACPDCGTPIERVILPCGINTHWSKSRLSDRNLAQHGFTKLTREGQGRYRESGAPLPLPGRGR